jgi:dipeptidyl-peptidase-4
VPRAELVVLDVQAGTVVRAQAEPLLMPQLSPIMIKWAWWAETARRCITSASPATCARSSAPAGTGHWRGHHRAPRERRHARGAQPVDDRADDHWARADEVLWYSQRDGWGYLYR